MSTQRESVVASGVCPISRLPVSGCAVPWPLGQPHSSCAALADDVALTKSLRHMASATHWSWPEHAVYFITDPHADADAFVASLYATGCIECRGTGPLGFELNAKGRRSEFILGGDCLDKGPANLELLRAVGRLRASGARLTLLAGNHDIRLLLGLCALGDKSDATSEHLFLRLGPKVVPLLNEVYDTYLAGRDPLMNVPDEERCREELFPAPDWFDTFANATSGRLAAPTIERELIRMRHKFTSFGDACNDANLSLRQVYAAAHKCRELFLREDGEFSWFFADMQLMCRRGAFLFVHAGIDDRIVVQLEEQGVDGVNQMFRQQSNLDLFGLYYGPVGNVFRTKYRDVDLQLSDEGVNRAHRLGLHVVVHGHRNRTAGQRLVLRHGLMHLECDVTLDRNSRRLEGLHGIGTGVTVIHPDGYVVGISNDYPDAKLFEPMVRIQREVHGTHAA